MDKAFQPIYGSLSSIFGRKEVLLIAVIIFSVGIAVTCRAQTAATLLAGRTIQGLGDGGITTLAEVILTDFVPLRLRGHYFAILSSVWAIGSMAGPVMGAGFAENLTWVSDISSAIR